MTTREKAELVWYQLREVYKVWYTQCKDNRTIMSVPIDYEEFNETFRGKYFPCERREVKVEEFINRRQGKMSVKDYFLSLPCFVGLVHLGV